MRNNVVIEPAHVLSIFFCVSNEPSDSGSLSSVSAWSEVEGTYDCRTHRVKPASSRISCEIQNIRGFS